jgi:hypothetical protein
MPDTLIEKAAAAMVLTNVTNTLELAQVKAAMWSTKHQF